MPIYRKASGSWTTIRNIYRKSGGVWTSIENVYRKAGGVWNSVFLRNNSPVIASRVTIASNVTMISDGQTATLTGRNYSWTPVSGLTLTYRFEKSTSISFASSTLVASGSISNPASGSSNTVTTSISPSDFSQTDMYFRFRVTGVNSSGTTASVSDTVGVSYYGTPVPEPGSPSITGSTTVGNTAFGNIGVWTNSPTQYDYRWYFMSGATSYPLTFSQSRSVSSKSLSGFSASLSTSTNHGYKVNDQLIVSSMDSLFNGTHTITSKNNSTVSFTLPTPTAFSITSAFTSGQFVSFNGNAYQAISSLSGSTAWTNAGTSYSAGDNVYYNSNRYRASSSLGAASLWTDAGTGYSSGAIVYSGSNRYQANVSFSSVSPYNGGTTYSSGTIVYSGTNRYQSTMNNNIGRSVTNYIYWTDLGSYDLTSSSIWTALGSYAPGSNSMWTSVMPNNTSFWTLQSFSNSSTSGTTTAPNYYEGSVSSSTSFSLTTPTTDYRSNLDMIGKTLYFAVKAHNPATLSPTEYSASRLVYGFPVITLGAVTKTDTSFSIAYTSSHMTRYIVDAKFSGTSVSGYPKTVTSPSSPIPVTGLSAGRNYDIYVTPYNGENTAGAIKTKNETTTSVPTTPTISAVSASYPSASVSVSFSGGNGPFYQMFWSISSTAPTGITNADASGILSPLTDNSGPSFAGTWYAYVRSTTEVDYTGTAPAQASPWSTGYQFTISNRPAVAFSYGAATSASGAWTASINSGAQAGAVYSLVSVSPGSASVNSSTGAVSASGLVSGQSSTVVVKKTVTDYNDTTASASGSATTIQYSVSWSNPFGTAGSSTTGPFNAGSSHTAPSPGTRAGFNFSNWRYPASGDLQATLQPGNPYIPTQNNITFTAVWTAIPVAGSVSSATGSTGGRNGSLSTSPWRDPKSTFRVTFANTTSATARIQRSSDNSTWTSGATEALTISSNVGTITTNQPTGTTSASANFWYRVQVISMNGTTLPTPITSSSIQNTVTAKNNVAVYP